MNKDNFYLKEVELCKQLEPILKKKGIEGDGYITEYGKVLTHEAFVAAYRNNREEGLERLKSLQNTWRKDSLEAALPDWVFAGYDRASSTCELGDSWHDAMYQIELKGGQELYWKVENILFDIFTNRNNLAKLAELIILLEKEQIS